MAQYLLLYQRPSGECCKRMEQERPNGPLSSSLGTDSATSTILLDKDRAEAIAASEGKIVNAQIHD